MKVVLIVLLLLTNVNADSFFSDEKKEKNSSYIISLKDLIIATQKTRGLTNSYLNGNSDVLPMIKKHKEEMKQAIEQLEASPMVSDPTIEFYTTTISQELNLLNETSLKMEPDIAFFNYTDEIAKLIEWAKVVSYRSKVTRNEIGQDITDLLTKVLLPMIEDIAQIRGRVSGVIAKGEINGENKEKILALKTEVNTLKIEMQDRMQRILTAYPNVYNDDTYKAVEYISDKIEKYMSTTDEILVSVSKNVDATKYFKQGSSIINMLLKLQKINYRASHM